MVELKDLPKSYTLRVESSYFVAGIDVEDGKVIHIADIVRYMRRWSERDILKYCHDKGWKVEVI